MKPELEMLLCVLGLVLALEFFAWLNRLPVGTKTLLFGWHQFALHPLMVGLAWWRLYGFPRDPRLWVAFVVHDWGYWGLPNLDGPEGERHVHGGAGVMGELFDAPKPLAQFDRRRRLAKLCNRLFGHKHSDSHDVGYRAMCYCGDWMDGHIQTDNHAPMAMSQPKDERLFHASWYCFTFYHSRFICAHYSIQPSRLCYADKYAIAICPSWLQLVLLNLTGEIVEHMAGAPGRTSGDGKTQSQWVREVKDVCRKVALEGAKKSPCQTPGPGAR